MTKTPRAVVTIAGEEVEGLVDTGYEGAIAVPMGFLEAHSLPRYASGEMGVAGGGRKSCWIAVATIAWLGGEREVDIAEWQDEDVLIGMDLLDGTRIELSSPTVTIEPLCKQP